MKIKNIFLLLTVISIVSFSSCKKEDSKSKTELLTAAAWKIKANYSIVGSTRTDLMPTMEACEKDNTYTFKTDNTVIFDEGATKCDDDDDQTDTGTWSLTENETKLILNGETSSLLSLTGSELKVSTSYTEDGVTYTNEVTLGH
ncbi:MAG: DUF5004 domain-containing protein [Agriterribacter sp.]